MEVCKKTHLVNVKAGLGNQFYMFAYADYIEKKGKKVKLFFYPSLLGDTTDRSKRNLNLDIPIRLNLKFIFGYNRIFAAIFYRFFDYFLSQKINLPFVKNITENSKEWAVYHPIDNIDFKYYNFHRGYFQSHRYVSDDFRKRLSNVVGSLCANENRYEITQNDVALHIRRGDFLAALTNFHKIETSYYIKALETLKTKIIIRNIFIFSDDFEAIKPEIEEISKVANVILVEGQSVLEDMNTLRLFSNYVLGNSTFAWWGAMLSVNETPNVYVPKEPWKVEMPNKSPYFPSWVQVENTL